MRMVGTKFRDIYYRIEYMKNIERTAELYRENENEPEYRK